MWVVLRCQAAMALGTLCGGWRIVRTVGSRITHLTPVQGFCMARYSRLHDAHRHGLGDCAPRIGGALGRGARHRGRLGNHRAGICLGGGELLLARHFGDAADFFLIGPLLHCSRDRGNVPR